VKNVVRDGLKGNKLGVNK
jgi:hypothetical protein